jgi:protein phosphatase
MIAEKYFAARQMRGGREHQEDTWAISAITGLDGRPEGLLVVVADGMGGHTSGEKASKLATRAFLRQFHRETGPVRERLQGSMTASNAAIAREFKRKPELEGMGTTLVAAAVTPGGIHWISVGDSLLYLLRHGKLRRLNDDHSFRPFLLAMVETGELTREQAARHPYRNLLRSALLGDGIELTDASEHPMALKEGDLILAATDGLQTLSDEEIARVLAGIPQNNNADAPVAALLRAVKKCRQPRQDNTTVAVVQFSSKALAGTPGKKCG